MVLPRDTFISSGQLGYLNDKIRMFRLRMLWLIISGMYKKITVFWYWITVKGKGKGKVSVLILAEHHVMKAYWGVEV
jgi:hypothetical protein